MRHVLAVLAVLVGCGKQAEHARPVQHGSIGVQPTTTSAPPPPPSTQSASDISAAGNVITIGRPRLQLVPRDYDDFDALVIRVGAKRVMAVDGDELKLWELEHGTLVARLALGAKDAHLNAILSADGTLFAGGRFAAMTVRREPFQAAEIDVKLGKPHAFSRDGQRLIASSLDALFIVDLVKKKVTATSPKPPLKRLVTLAASESDDGAQVWWLGSAGLVRWDRATDQLTVVTRPAAPWKDAKISLRAPVALVADDKTLSHIDLVTGALTKVGPASLAFDISPDGTRAITTTVNRVTIVEISSGRQVANFDFPAGYDRVAYSEDIDVIAVTVRGQIQIIDLAKGPRAPERPSRFAGWLANGVVAIDRDGAREQFDVATRAVAPRTGSLATSAPGVLAVETSKRAIVVRDATGATLASLDVGTPPRTGTDLEHEYVAAVASPRTKHVALWWRRADVQAPPPEEQPGRDVTHTYEGKPPVCERDRDHHCKMEYFAELWSFDGAPKRVWQLRPNAKVQPNLRRWPLPKIASGPLVFTHDGALVLMGFSDGDVIVRRTAADGAQLVESHHRAPITRIEVAPGNRWVFTEDAEGEQRIWPLSAP